MIIWRKDNNNNHNNKKDNQNENNSYNINTNNNNNNSYNNNNNDNNNIWGDKGGGVTRLTLVTRGDGTEGGEEEKERGKLLQINGRDL